MSGITHGRTGGWSERRAVTGAERQDGGTGEKNPAARSPSLT